MNIENKLRNATLEQLLSQLPQGVWYSMIWDSEGDFLISNVENRDFLRDLFLELKKRKKHNRQN